MYLVLEFVNRNELLVTSYKKSSSIPIFDQPLENCAIIFSKFNRDIYLTYWAQLISNAKNIQEGYDKIILEIMRKEGKQCT